MKKKPSKTIYVTLLHHRFYQARLFYNRTQKSLISTAVPQQVEPSEQPEAPKQELDFFSIPAEEVESQINSHITRHRQQAVLHTSTMKLLLILMYANSLVKDGIKLMQPPAAKIF